MSATAHPPEACRWAPRHLPVVLYTRSWRQGFRKRYIVKCWGFCDLQAGPFKTRVEAEAERLVLEAE